MTLRQYLLYCKKEHSNGGLTVLLDDLRGDVVLGPCIESIEAFPELFKRNIAHFHLAACIVVRGDNG